MSTLLRKYLERVFVLGNTVGISSGNLPWEFAVGICHNFAGKIFRGHLPWLPSVEICRGCFQMCEKVFFDIDVLFYNWKLFLLEFFLLKIWQLWTTVKIRFYLEEAPKDVFSAETVSQISQTNILEGVHITAKLGWLRNIRGRRFYFFN